MWIGGDYSDVYYFQNVPVHTAQDWADEVKLFCEGKLEMTNYSFMKQDNMTKSIAECDNFLSPRVRQTPPKVSRDYFRESDFEPEPKVQRTNNVSGPC